MPASESFNGSVFVFPDDYSHSNQEFSVYGGGQEIVEATGIMTEPEMVYRKAEESASRRYHAASWMQRVLGPLDLSNEPSEEEFRHFLRNGLWLCKLVNKVHPGSVPRIVESSPSVPAEGALSAYQYFENVRNFLVAVDELNVPTFDASDLEETSFVTGSVARVTDSILGLKSYHEWKENGGTGRWKHGVTVKSGLCNNSKSILTFSLDEGGNCLLTNSAKLINGKAARKRCILPDMDFLSETQLLLPEEPPDLAGSEAMYEEPTISDSFSKQDIFTLEGLSRSFDAVESQSPASLSNTVRALLSEKQPDEIPMVVEFMLQKVMEEYRRRFFAQGLQLKKLKNELKEALNRGGDRSMKLDDSPRNSDQSFFDPLRLMKGLREASRNTRQDVMAMKRNWTMEIEHLESRLQGLVAAASGYQKVLSENRRLYNEVQDLKGSIRVYCRVRPLLSGDLERKTTVEFIGENGDIIISNPKRQGKDACRNFRFNKVFRVSASQEQVFLDTQPLIRSVLDGYNVCIFAYGQTGSGKTYTMSGPPNASEELWGVNYRALNDLFHISQSRRAICRYGIAVQMVEIYNEQVRDLLASDGPTKKLEIRNNSQQNGLSVPNASMLAVNCTGDVLELMKAGEKNRAIGATALNERSSRSHSVLTIHVQGKDLVSGSILRGCLHLIDLAGSERVNKSEATGDRLKEAQHINKSLSALGDVISALSQKNGHVPYRNSKLTQLLQDSLGGQAKTLMFVHINPDVESYGETMSTLKFAERVASIELGAARTNKETGELQELKEQIMTLKDSLSKKDADLDKLLLLRNVRESASTIEKQRRRQNVDEHEPKARKQFTEGLTKPRESSPPVRDRGRRLSPPGYIFGDIERAYSPSKGENAEPKRRIIPRSKQQVTSPKSPVSEDFAPKSPYRERHHRNRHSHSKTRGMSDIKSKSFCDQESSVFLVNSPPSHGERLKSPDVDGFINKELELSRDSPVLCALTDDHPLSDSQGETSNALQQGASSPELKDTGDDMVVYASQSDNETDNKIQSSKTVERVESISQTVYSIPPVQRVASEERQEERRVKGHNRSTAQKSGLPKARKAQPISCVRRKSVVTSRTESPRITRTTNSLPYSLGC